MKRCHAGIAGALALALALMLPGAAWAGEIAYEGDKIDNPARSPQGTTFSLVSSSEDIVVTQMGVMPDGQKVDIYGEPNPGGTYMGSFTFTANPVSSGPEINSAVDVCFNLGKQYSGRLVTVYKAAAYVEGGPTIRTFPELLTVDDSGVAVVRDGVSNSPNGDNPVPGLTTSYSINLEPEGLGPLDGKVSFREGVAGKVTSSEGATATVLAATRDLIFGDLSALEAPHPSMLPHDGYPGIYVEPLEGGVYMGSFSATANGGDLRSGYARVVFEFDLGEEFSGREVSIYHGRLFHMGSGAFMDESGCEKAVADFDGTVTFSAFASPSGSTYYFSLNVEPAKDVAPGPQPEDPQPEAPKPEGPKQEIVGVAESAAGSAISVVETEGVTSGTFEKVEATEKLARNVELSDHGVVLGSYEIAGDEFKDFALSFRVDKKYAGQLATLFVEHEDGTTDRFDSTISVDGVVAFNMDGLSVYTLAVGAKSIEPDEGAAATPENGATSGSNVLPQTGDTALLTIASTAVAGMSVLASAAHAAHRRR